VCPGCFISLFSYYLNMYPIERQYSADVTSTHALYCFRGWFFVAWDRFRLTEPSVDLARMDGEEKQK
jgi:hypothetical protein